MLAYANVCSRMLTYAHVCSRMLTYAHVCSRMLTYADGWSSSGKVAISGPRDVVLKLKEKVKALISGLAAPPASADPLAYIEPYIQGGVSQRSGPVPKEAQVLLVQKYLLY
jgi:hypothetical protein